MKLLLFMFKWSHIKLKLDCDVYQQNICLLQIVFHILFLKRRVIRAVDSPVHFLAFAYLMLAEDCHDHLSIRILGKISTNGATWDFRSLEAPE